MLRLFIWAIVFYFIYKFIKGFTYLTFGNNQKQTTTSRPQPVSKQNNNTAINQKDIVEAEFVEIKNPNE